MIPNKHCFASAFSSCSKYLPYFFERAPPSDKRPYQYWSSYEKNKNNSYMYIRWSETILYDDTI